MDHQGTSLDAPSDSNTFTASWTPSKATALDANNVPIAKVPRAWERKPSQSKGDNGKTKIVWKRYGLRSQPNVNEEGAIEAQMNERTAEKSPGKVVKKKRVASPVKDDNGEILSTRSRRKSSATRYERRKSGYRRKPVNSATIDASFTPTFDALIEEETLAEPTKGHATTHQASVYTAIVDVQEDTTAEDVLPSEAMEEEEEDSMCEAAEIQLLNEAGLEPIPADFAISPMKKMPRAPQEIPPTQVVKPQEAQDEQNDSVMEVDDRITPVEKTMQYPLLEVPIESPNSSPAKVATEAPSTPEVQQSAKQDQPVNRGISYPSIDIFGLDDDDVELPRTDQTLAATDARDENQDSPTETFTVSLNDETVNIGALLARNDHLSATITDDEIVLGAAEAQEDSELESPQTEDVTMQLKTDESSSERPESPDELSMDLDATEMTATDSNTFAHLEDDKAKLSSFLRRMAERKEKKSTTVERRESLQDKQHTDNRRDSDVVRKALASPRPALEEKDKNVSPIRQPQESSLNLNQVLKSDFVKPEADQIAADPEDLDELSSEYQNGSPRRRSSRTRSKLPQSSGQTVIPNKISVRTDGGEKVNLNRSETQLLADLVKKNTKRNKGPAIPAPQRLARLKLESLALIVDGESPIVERLIKQGTKSVVWREQLAEYATSTATADLEAEAAVAAALETEPKKKSGTATPRLRKLRTLGGTNGTPAKKILQSIQLPDEIEEDKPAKIAATTANAKKKRSIPALTVALSSEESAQSTNAEPVEEDKKLVATVQKKSKLQPPKKLNLNPSLTSIGGIVSGLPVLQGKENALAGLSSPAKKMSKIPAPSGIPTPSAVSLDITGGIRPPVKRMRSGTVKKV